MQTVTIKKHPVKHCGSVARTREAEKHREKDMMVQTCIRCKSVYSAPPDKAETDLPAVCTAAVVYQLRWSTTELISGEELNGKFERGWFLRDYPYTAIDIEVSRPMTYDIWEALKARIEKCQAQATPETPAAV